MKSILLFVSVLGILGCSCPTEKEGIVQDEYLDQLLKIALEDALVPEADEILPLHDISDDTVYSFDGVDYIEAVAWVNDDYLHNWKDALKKPDRKYTINIADIPIWLTIVPQVQDFCSSTFFQSKQDLEIRLKQKLGLNYQKVYSHFVEMYVPLRHLRRPCINPDVRQTYCPPCSADAEIDSQANFYYKWRKNIHEKNEFPVPFTGLGYTYDWGAEDSEIGFSEFVFITDGVTPVLVKSVNSTIDYCTK